MLLSWHFVKVFSIIKSKQNLRWSVNEKKSEIMY